MSAVRRGVPALAAVGAVLAACGVGLAAYASHAAAPDALRRLGLAALFLSLHGIALAALAPQAHRGLSRLSLCLLLLGTLVFCGTLIAAHIFATSTAAAPLGGMAMILAWLLYAAAVLATGRVSPKD